MVWDTAHEITFSHHSNNRLVGSVIAVSVFIALVCSISWLVLKLVGVEAGRVSSQQLVVIDTDPGVDDTLAILTTLGDPNIKVLGITCVRGNTEVPNVFINTLKILQVAHKEEIPVYTSHNHGLVNAPASGDWFGSDGLGDLPYSDPPSPSKAQHEHAASYLARIVQEYPGEITILAIGPLTNIALALHLNPAFLNQARRVIILGGSIRGLGNIAPGIEFNFFMDPDAAKFVLDMALANNTTLTLMSLETCSENQLTNDWRWSTLGKINNSVVSFLNSLDAKIMQMHPSSMYLPFDTYAAAVTLCTDFVTSTQELYGFVENSASRTQGALIVDYRNITNNMANLEIIIAVNTSVVKKKIFENLSNFI